jgi:molybdopterin synthase catalytic subunit
VDIRIVDGPFDPLAELGRCQDALATRMPSIGAMASFVGTMRDFNDGAAVEAMVLEHYPGMTDEHLARSAREAAARWGLDEVLIVHRVGTIRPGEAIVLVATWAAHRAHAFESCRHLMEDLKSTAPFWKREETARGPRWVARNTPGTSAAFEPD